MIRDVVIDVLVLGIAVGIFVGLWRAYRPILRVARRDLAGFCAALQADRAQHVAEAQFLDGQARRSTAPYAERSAARTAGGWYLGCCACSARTAPG